MGNATDRAADGVHPQKPLSLSQLMLVRLAIEAVKKGNSIGTLAKQIEQGVGSLPTSRGSIDSAIKAFEQATGLDLFENPTGHRSSIRAGLEEHADRAVEIITQMENHARSLLALGRQRVETVRVATYPSILNFFLPAIARLALNEPREDGRKINLEFGLDDGHSMIEKIISREYDFGLTTWYPKLLERSDVLGKVVGVLLDYRWADYGIIFRKDVDPDLIPWAEPEGVSPSRTGRKKAPGTQADLIALLKAKRMLLSSGDSATEDTIEGRMKRIFMEPPVGDVVLLPTYRHIRTFVKFGSGVGVGPRVEPHEEQDWKGRIGFIPIRNLDETLAEKNGEQIALYLRKGWNDKSSDALSATARKLALLIREMCRKGALQQRLEPELAAMFRHDERTGHLQHILTL